MISGQRYGGLMLSPEKRPEDLVRVDVIRKHQIITLTRHNITPSFTLLHSTGKKQVVQKTTVSTITA